MYQFQTWQVMPSVLLMQDGSKSFLYVAAWLSLLAAPVMLELSCGMAWMKLGECFDEKEMRFKCIIKLIEYGHMKTQSIHSKIAINFSCVVIYYGVMKV